MIPPIVDGDCVYSDPNKKATRLNNCFVKNSTQDEFPSSFALPPMKYISDFKVSNIVFTHGKLFKALKELKVNKANGPDNIINRMLKNIAEVIAEPLYSLFTKLMNSGYFLSKWKTANVTPLDKKADKQHKENYRQVPLLSLSRKSNGAYSIQ